MTLHETAYWLMRLTEGKLNGEVYTNAELGYVLEKAFRTGTSYYMIGTLPDGDWLIRVFQYNDTADGYDYYLPDTRAEETLLKRKFLAEAL